MSEDNNDSAMLWLDLKARFLLKDEIDLDNRLITINGGISLKSYIKFDKQLRLLENLHKDPITVIINSQGGSVYDGFAFVDRILKSRCEVNTHAMGLIASAALPIFVAGEMRSAGHLTSFMHHSPSYGVGHETIHNHAVELVHTKDLANRFNKFLASRTNKPYSFWSAVGKTSDFYFDAEKAIELGVLHELD